MVFDIDRETIFMRGMEDHKRIIEIGASICSIVRQTYFNDMPWSQCCMKVADKFTQLKKKARVFYGEMDECDLLLNLAKYSPSDVKEMLD